MDRTLTWEQILEMERAGATIGAHTHTHQILTAVSDETARREIRDCKRAIEDRLHQRCTLFAYPNGNHGRRARELLAEVGFELAFTTEPGAWTRDCDRLRVPGQALAEDDIVGPRGRFSPTMFEYAVFWRAHRALSRGGA